MSTVYRLYDATGILLYVGCTTNLDRRLKRHAATKPWWPDVAHMVAQSFNVAEEADWAERIAIRDEDPKHNIMRYTPPRYDVWVKAQRAADQRAGGWPFWRAATIEPWIAEQRKD
jgi:excinuclease UvrABC nuclease subunit